MGLSPLERRGFTGGARCVTVAVKMSADTFVSSFPDGTEFVRFTQAHPSFLRSLDEIAASFTDLFGAIEQQDSSTPNDTLYLLVGAAYTEFEEVLVLGLNGYGSGSTKLLRALYERTVTAQYLMKHPDKVQQFIDFTNVHWHKLLLEADTNGAGKELSEERRDEIETHFKAVEESFTEIVCKTCGKSRLQGSWTKKPVPTQAREIGEALGTLCFHGYLMPTFFLHTTFWGISQQMKWHESGKKELHNPELERDHAARAIVIATNLMAQLACSINDYYKLYKPQQCENIMSAVNQIGKDILAPTENEPESRPQNP